MEYKWNETKATLNERKHGIDFADAVMVFEDGNALTIEDSDHGESRFITMGVDASGKLLVVVYSYGDENMIRIISARKANKIEQRFYSRGGKKR